MRGSSVSLIFADFPQFFRNNLFIILWFCVLANKVRFLCLLLEKSGNGVYCEWKIKENAVVIS